MSVMRLFLIGAALLFAVSCGEDAVTSSCSLHADSVQVVATGGSFLMPRFSPDEKTVLFSGAKFQGLFLASLSDGSVRMLSDNPGEGYEASFSGDGRYIASATLGAHGSARLYSVEDGSEVWKRTHLGRVTPPVWSGGLPRWVDRTKHRHIVPDIRVKTVSSRDVLPVVWTEKNRVMMSVNGKTVAIADGYAARISPDGTRVLFKRSGVIYVYDIAARKETALVSGDHSQWLSDGSGVVFVKTEDDG